MLLLLTWCFMIFFRYFWTLDLYYPKFCYSIESFNVLHLLAIGDPSKFRKRPWTSTNNTCQSFFSAPSKFAVKTEKSSTNNGGLVISALNVGSLASFSVSLLVLHVWNLYNYPQMLHLWSIYPHLPYISAKCKPNKQTCHWVIVLFFFDVKKQDVWTTSGILYLCTLCIIISSCGYLYNLRCEAMRWQHLKTAMKSQEDLYWSHMLHVLRGTFPVSLRRLVEFSPVAFVPYPWAAFGGGMVRIGAQKGTSSILC